jgi:hypothetical protein
VASDSVAVSTALVDSDGRTWTIKELTDVAVEARKDDPAALETLERSFSASHSWWGYLGGDMARHAEECLVRASTTSKFGRLMVLRTLERTCNDLAGPRPTPLVRLAARNVAYCSLEADLAHRSSAAHLEKGNLPPEAIQRWQDRADGRFRKALKIAADLQRLQLPTVQVNVGGQQVNIGTAHVGLADPAGGPAFAILAGSDGPSLREAETASD